MAEIAARVTGKQEGGSAEPAREVHAVAAITGEKPAGSEGRSLQLTLDDIVHPAYMVNYNFEMTWYNETARKEILGFETPPPGSESRSIFLLLLEAFAESNVLRLNPLLQSSPSVRQGPPVQVQRARPAQEHHA